MTEAEEIKWALKILSYEIASLEKGKEIPEELEKASKLIQFAIQMRVSRDWYSRSLESLDELMHEISSTVDTGEVVHRGGTKLSNYWRWRLWMDCMGDVPEQIELLFQGLVGAQFDAARKNAT